MQLNTRNIPQVPTAENQLSFQQKSSKHLQEFFNGEMREKCRKTHLYTNIILPILLYYNTLLTSLLRCIFCSIH